MCWEFHCEIVEGIVARVSFDGDVCLLLGEEVFCEVEALWGEEVDGVHEESEAVVVLAVDVDVLVFEESGVREVCLGFVW